VKAPAAALALVPRSALGLRQARAAIARGSHSFAFASKLLPPAARDDAACLYAYCRRADDLVDDAGPAAAAVAVPRLRGELEGMIAGGPAAAPPGEPALARFAEVMHRRAIPRVHLDELLAGFAMDAVPGPIVYETWADLLLYCHRVAGTVGLMMCHVMGVRDARAARPAAALGMAMQLTNIARDVAEDWRRGRLYLPREALGGASLTPGGPLDPASAAVLNRALPTLLAAAAPLYRWGDAGLAHLPRRCAIAVRAARLIYSDIGRVIAGRGYDVTAGRARVSGRRKLWLGLRAMAGGGARRVIDHDNEYVRALPDFLACALPRPFRDLPSRSAEVIS
jgi:phytoene synthase